MHLTRGDVRASSFCEASHTAYGLALCQLAVIEWACRAEKLFPITELSLVLHSLLHVVEDIRRFGPVSGFRMFGFERYVLSSWSLYVHCFIYLTRACLAGSSASLRAPSTAEAHLRQSLLGESSFTTN